MEESRYDYGYWGLVAFNIVVFAFFVLAYFRPQTKWDWRSAGAFMAFVIALFTEMYGFPLTIYFLAGWLLSKYPELDLFAHTTGRLWQTIFNLRSDVAWYSFFAVSHILVWGGVAFLWWSWRHLYRAQKEKEIARTGPYAFVRHPQYIAFFSVMLGFLIQWPTLPTLVMFPFLVITYYWLARKEEADSLKEFGKDYERYRQQVPAFLPKLL